MTLWGSGKARREFIFSDDVAEASLFVMQHVNQLENKHYNVGTGQDFSIEELATSVAKIIGYEGKVSWDTSKPDGTPRKLLDSSRLLSLGWKPIVSLEDGLRRTYRWYQNRSNTISQESEIFVDSHAK